MIFGPPPPPPPSPAPLEEEAPPAPTFGAADKVFTWIFGVSGMGKTLYARALYRARISKAGRGVFVDPNAKNGDLGRVVRGPAELAAALREAGRGPFSLVLQPEWGKSISGAWRMMFDAGWLLVVVDEAKRFGSAATLDRQFEELVTVGRNRNVDIVTTSQGPVSLAPSIRQNWDVCVSFRQSSAQYAAHLAGDYFPHPRAAELLQRLERFQYLRTDQRGRMEAGELRDPAIYGG